MTALKIPAHTVAPGRGATLADTTRKHGGAEFGRLMASATSRAREGQPAPDQTCGGEGSGRQGPIRSDSGPDGPRPDMDRPQPAEAQSEPALHDISTGDDPCESLWADNPPPEHSESESDIVEAPLTNGVMSQLQAPPASVADDEHTDSVASDPDGKPELNGPATMRRAEALGLIRSDSEPDAKSPEQPDTQPTGDLTQQRNLQQNPRAASPQAEIFASTATPDSQAIPDPVIGFAATAPPPRELAATHDLLAGTRAAALPEPHRQIADAVVRTRSGQVEIMLDPVELGRVTVLLGEDGNPGRLAVLVERPETLELMRRNSDQLLRDLRENGMPDARLEDLRQDSFGNRRESASPPAARDRPQAQDQHPSELAAVPARAVVLTRLDIRF